MEKKRYKIALHSLNVLLILLFVLPLWISGAVRCEDCDYVWKSTFLFEDTGSLILAIPIVVLVVLPQIIKKVKVIKIIRRSSLILFFLYSAVTFLAAGMPAQDFAPSWGFLIIILLFPVSLVVYYFEKAHLKY